MPTFYFTGERHTLLSMLRPALEEAAAEDDFVACTLLHPLDEHVVVEAPSEGAVRLALLDLKRRIADNRAAASSARAACPSPQTGC
jgi:DNA-directed RNA polymerase subunit L